MERLWRSQLVYACNTRCRFLILLAVVAQKHTCVARLYRAETSFDGIALTGQRLFPGLLPWAPRARAAHGYYGSGLRPDGIRPLRGTISFRRFPSGFRLRQGFGGQASVRPHPYFNL